MALCTCKYLGSGNDPHCLNCHPEKQVNRPEKRYLGDSVYLDFDGYSLLLTTENGEGPSNTIILNPLVYKALVKYVDELNEEQEENGQ